MNFESEITLEKDKTLTVKETITVNFPYPKHGIFRIIPVVYSAKGRTIRASFDVVSITGENGLAYKYEKSRLGRSVKLKIGDPDTEVAGIKTYIS